MPLNVMIWVYDIPFFVFFAQLDRLVVSVYALLYSFNSVLHLIYKTLQIACAQTLNPKP